MIDVKFGDTPLFLLLVSVTKFCAYPNECYFYNLFSCSILLTVNLFHMTIELNGDTDTLFAAMRNMIT